MMKRLSGILVAYSTIMVACSHSDLRNSSTGETAFHYQDFEQRAPASLKPQFKDDGTLDELHMKMQADYHFTMAEAYSLEGDSDKAIESYKLTLAYDADAYEVRVKLAAEYLRRGYVSEAIEQAKLAVQAKPDLVSAHFLLAGIYTSLRMFNKAKDQYNKVVELKPESEEARLYLGALYVEEGKYPEALKEFRAVTELEEGKARHLGYFYMAKVYAAQEQDKKAESHYQKALEMKPDFVDAVLALGNDYKKDSNAKAIRFYDSYLEKYGNEERILEVLAMIHLEQEDYEMALKRFKVLETMNPSLNAKVKIAMIYIEQKKYDEAIDRLQAILNEVPESDKIRFYLAAIYEEIGQNKKAIELYRQIPLASSYFVDASIHGIYLMKMEGQVEEAIKWNEDVLKKRGDVLQFYTLYASLLDQKSNYKGAVKFLSDAEAQFPDNPQIQYFLGSFFDKVGDKEESMRRMRRVLELNEDHSQAMNFLAYTMAELSVDLDEAEDYALRALEIKPQDAFYMDTLGWVYYKKGEYEKAIQYLEVAFKLEPEESVIAQHLGDAYYKFNLPAKAVKYYQHALKHEKDENEQSKLQRKLASVKKALSLPSANRTTQKLEAERQPASVND